MVETEKDVCPYCDTVDDHQVMKTYMHGYDYIYKMRCNNCRCIFESLYKLKYDHQNILKKGDFKR